MDYSKNLSSRSSAGPSITPYSNNRSSSNLVRTTSGGVGGSIVNSAIGGHMSNGVGVGLNAYPNAQAVAMTIGKCMCCSSTLRFPVSVSCFRCTVCQTINDLKPTTQKEIMPLTLDYIHSLIVTCRNQQSSRGVPDYELLEEAISKCFSNWHSLNASFSNGRSVSLDDCGVALDQVREAYRILLELPVNVIRVMMKSIENVLKRPGRILKHTDEIKFLMIILENPLLSQHNFPRESQYHHNIVKRIFGLLSNLTNELHHYLVNWFSRLSVTTFRKRVELVNAFISSRLTKQQRNACPGPVPTYESDWQIGSAARVMALLFAANKQHSKISLSDFYNAMVDCIDFIVDYDNWEQRTGKFAFCQYPFLISMGGKMQIMEFDAKRQMDIKAKEAFFTILFEKRLTTPQLILRVHRDNLIEDSLNQLASHEMDIKKSLRIEFIDEDGVDAGGLRKEWFLLLVRELFDPQYGMFTWDEDSNLCWFNPASFEASDQYYLVGVVIGLAIYNSTILDVHLPLACYKKLLNIPVTLEDLKVFRPAFANGLEKLLTLPDVESTFLDFVGEYESYGEIVRVPLITGGENIPVTNKNREEYVNRYVNFVLNESIAKQFDPFKRGFNHVCGGNALSLFQPEEIELLVRGSDEPLRIEQLRTVTVYEGFREDEETIRNFWILFKEMNPLMQRKLLTFVTGTDRIPATGVENLAFKITCIGEDSERFPIAHTCFNQICLYRYRTKRKLEAKLIRAITDSEGFGLK